MFLTIIMRSLRGNMVAWPCIGFCMGIWPVLFHPFLVANTTSTHTESQQPNPRHWYALLATEPVAQAQHLIDRLPWHHGNVFEV
ncbi:hypothetical protein DFJ73DRAFT_883208 [Zopfochytrium polystomum]|nr:hypothetical protein DFJ73DRAFT_883208 [Zopfochytrium polystomum]